MTLPRLLRTRQWSAVLVAAAAAFVLRALHWGHGLPEFLEEAWPFREAWAMWGWEANRIDLNPHRFHYPSLTFYLHFLLQLAQYGLGVFTGAWRTRADLFVDFHTDPGALVVAARAMGTVFEAAGIAAVAWLGERLRPGAGFAAGLVLALSPAMLNGVRAIVPDTYVAALAAFALYAMLRGLRGGGRGSLAAAVVCIGLATGAKYPAATLLLPLGAVLIVRGGRRALWTWPLAAAGAFAVFLLTTPYALLDTQTFLRDLGFVRQLPGAGHLGRLEGSGAAFNLGTLWRNLSPVGVALLPVSLVMTARRWRERREEAVLWIALAGFAVPVFTARVEAERYMVPVLVPAALLAAAALTGLAGRLPERLRGAGRVLAPLLLLAPLAWAVLPRALVDPVSTQALAARWFERNASPADLTVQEAYGAPLHTRLRALDMQAHPRFAEASAPVRERYLGRTAFRAVQLPLTTVGPGTVTVPGIDGHEVTVPLADHAVEFNHLSYDPRLVAGADYFVTTSAVRGRFAADPGRFPAEVAFYRLLDATADVARVITPSADAAGPEITVHRVTRTFRDSVAALPPIDPLWWAATLPRAGRVALETAALPPEARVDGALRTADGSPAPWVIKLDRMYASLVRPFAHPMAVYLVELGRTGPARFFAAATLEVLPLDIEACLVYTTACAGEGAWIAARRAAERTIGMIAREGEPPPVLQLEYARILARTGDAPMAREILALLAGRGDERLAAEARAALEEIGP